MRREEKRRPKIGKDGVEEEEKKHSKMEEKTHGGGGGGKVRGGEGRLVNR